MSISFSNIPSNVKVPLFYAEMDNSQAGYFTQNQRTLLIGQKLAAGSAAANVPVLVSSVDQAKSFFGQGSMLAAMMNAYRQNDGFGEVWCLPLDDDGAAVAATGTVVVTGTSTAAGTLVLYVAGQKVNVAVTASMTATQVATAIAAAINANADLPVTASSSTGTVTLTARNKGLAGNDIQVILNYYGASGGEVTPAGITVTPNAFASGATNPTLTTAITNMGDEPYDFIVLPYNDATSLNALQAELNDSTGRWAWNRQVYGGVFGAMRGTLSALTTFGGNRNDQHASIFGYEADVPNPVWEVAAAYGARSAKYLSIDPARPTQTGELLGIMPARAGKRWLLTEQQSLLSYGITPGSVGGGVLRIVRGITTYQKNAYNQPDPSYFDVTTLYTSMYILRNLKYRITQKYPRHKLANDGTRFGAGQAIVTPSVIRSELIAAYAEMERDGIVEDSENFQANLLVERDPNNPNRVNVLFPPDYVNALSVLAVLNQFRLQYPQAA